MDGRIFSILYTCTHPAAAYPPDNDAAAAEDDDDCYIQATSEEYASRSLEQASHSLVMTHQRMYGGPRRHPDPFLSALVTPHIPLPTV
eukprot:408407-Rhodomonas_salina.2